MADAEWEATDDSVSRLPPPPPRAAPAPGAPGAEVGPWRTFLGGLGWLLTFIAIFNVTNAVLRLALEALGVDTTAAGPTGGDEENPPGQVLALLAALAIGVGATLLLRLWYRSGSVSPPPQALGGDGQG